MPERTAQAKAQSAQPARLRAPGDVLAGDDTPEAMVRTLQRLAGNRAVTELFGGSRDDPAARTIVQRQVPPTAGDTEARTAADFEVSGGVPVPSGSTSVSAAGDSVLATASRVDMPFSASLREGRKLSASQYVGYIQNLVSSDRVGIYRKGGDPTGEIVQEQHSARRARWDAVVDPKGLAKPEPEIRKHEAVFPPWYWVPKSISDLNRTDQPVKSDAEHDQPVAMFAPEVVDERLGKGRLTETRGADRFNLGLVVKGSIGLVRLTAATWSVPWDATLDVSQSGRGEAAEADILADLEKGPDPGLSTWSFEERPGDVFEGFSTLEQAMRRTPSELMKWLFAAKAHDVISYANICQALDAKDPMVQVGVSCTETDAWLGRDQLQVAVRAGGEDRHFTALALDAENPAKIPLRFRSLFGSASSITEATSVEVELTLGGATAIGRVGFPFIGAAGPLALKSGAYNVTVGL